MREGGKERKVTKPYKATINPCCTIPGSTNNACEDLHHTLGSDTVSPHACDSGYKCRQSDRWSDYEVHRASPWWNTWPCEERRTPSVSHVTW